MESTKKIPAFIYLDKNGFYFFQDNLPTIVSMAFIETSIKDMDVINSNSLSAQIKSFVEQYQILPSTITLILSPNITFEKDIVDVPIQSRDEAIKSFVETVPFESVLSRSFPIDKGLKVIGFNEDLYLELKIAFEKIASTIENAIPYQMLGADQALMREFTKENAAQLLRKLDRLKQFSLVTTEKEKPQAPQNTKESTNTKPKTISPRLIAMAVVFVILFAILGFMIMNMGKT